MELKELAQLAPIATATIAATALIVAYRQLRTARRNEAKRQYISFLDEAAKHPYIGKRPNPESDQKAYREYIWFRAKMLMAFEEVLDAFPRDKAWREVIKANLIHCEPYLNSFGRRAMYSKKLTRLVAAVVQPASQPGTR